MSIQRTLAGTLVLGWCLGWLAPLALFVTSLGFCADCTCCAELFGGRVACVKDQAPIAGVSMSCDDEPESETPVVPPTLSKARPGVVSGAITVDCPRLEEGLVWVRSLSLATIDTSPETPPPRS